MKCCIGSLVFSSKTDAYNHTRMIIRKGERTITEEHEDWDFFCDLILNHKSGKALEREHIKLFCVCKDRWGKPQATYYLTNNNERITFSWVDCSRSSKKVWNGRTLAISAMRVAIEPFTLETLKKSIGCCRCGCSRNLEIDHYDMTFKELTEMYFKKYGIPKIARWRESRYEKLPVIANEAKWVKFHNENTHLQVLCKGCHNIKTKKDNNNGKIIHEK